MRHHLAPRIARFTPVGVRGAPAVESLLDERETIITEHAGIGKCRAELLLKEKDELP